MKLGIVVEYNPFHNGHLYQIKKIKEKFRNDISIIIVMSGDFVQRGEFSYFDKWQKTKIALEYGIDLIVELPLYYAIQNAEVFSKMAVKILDYLEVDVQVFGAEEQNIEKLFEVVKLQEKKEYNDKVIELIKKGHSYTTAQKLVLAEYGYENIVKSNNILGIEYIRAIRQNNLKIKPFIIKREISEYNELEIEKERKNIVSATFIRENLKRKLEQIKDFVPEKVFEVIKEKNKNESFFVKEKNYYFEKIFMIFKYKFLTSSEENIIKIYDMKEQLYDRIYNGLLYSKSWVEFLKIVKSRNFSIKRIQRLVLNILLEIKKESFNFEIDYIRILGFNKKGQEILKDLKNKKIENIFVNWKDIEKLSSFNCENKIINEKIKIEKNGFLLKEIIFEKKEILNPIISAVNNY